MAFFKNDYGAVFYIIFIYILLSFYVSLFSLSIFDVDVRSYLAVIKSVLVVLLLFKFTVRNNPTLLWCTLIFFGVYIVVQLVLTDAAFTMPFYGYLINSFIPLLLFLVAINAPSKNIQLDKYLYVIFLVALFVIPISYILNYHFIDPAIIEYQQHLKGYPVIDGFPRNWWSKINGDLYLRFSSSAEDPILYGYFFAFLGYIFFYRGDYLFSLVSVFLVALTIVKGAFILFIASVVIVLILYFFLLCGIARLTNKVLSFFFAVIVFIYVFLPSVTNTSADVHLLGFLLPFKNALATGFNLELFFGNGIGTSGNLYKASMGGDVEYLDWLSGGAESGFGLIFYQLGLIGFIFFLIMIFLCLCNLHSFWSKSIWTVYWANSTMQENLINLNYIALLFFCVIYIEGRERYRESRRFTLKVE